MVSSKHTKLDKSPAHDLRGKKGARMDLMAINQAEPWFIWVLIGSMWVVGYFSGKWQGYNEYMERVRKGRKKKADRNG